MYKFLKHASRHFGTALDIGVEIANTGKSSVYAATLDGCPVAIKGIISENVYYQETFRNGLVIYSRFDTNPVDCAPSILALNDSPPYVILQQVPGSPLSLERYLDPNQVTWDKMMEIVHVLESFGRYQGIPVESKEAVIKAYRKRWTKYVERKIFTQEDFDILAKLEKCADWLPEFNHGDTVPSNIFDDNGTIKIIDWEFAGSYVPGYDISVLWAICGNIPPIQRKLEDNYLSNMRKVQLTFACNLLNVASRELHIHLALPENHVLRSRLPMLNGLLARAREIGHSL